MSQVIQIADLKKPVNADLVETLQELLEKAEAGEITSAAIAYRSGPERTRTTGWHLGEGDDVMGLIGAVAYLKHRMLCGEDE